MIWDEKGKVSRSARSDKMGGELIHKDKVGGAFIHKDNLVGLFSYVCFPLQGVSKNGRGVGV